MTATLPARVAVIIARTRPLSSHTAPRDTAPLVSAPERFGQWAACLSATVTDIPERTN